MARFRYSRRDKYDAAFDPQRCAESVAEPGRGIRFHQCSRVRWQDSEWCRQHHPDTEAAKAVERDKKFLAQRTREELNTLCSSLRRTIERLQKGAMSRDRAMAIQFLECELKAVLKEKDNGTEATDPSSEG